MEDTEVQRLIRVISENDRLNGKAGYTDPRGNLIRQDAINQAQSALADEYGRRRGWHRIERRLFGVRALARRAVHDRDDSYGRYDPDFMDHPYWYRRNRRAAAIVAHLYDVDPEIEDFAAGNGLLVEFPTDFPSWWNPGRTTLVVYLPRQ